MSIKKENKMYNILKSVLLMVLLMIFLTCGGNQENPADVQAIQDALTEAAANGKADTIQITAGNYEVNVTLTYNSDEAYALVIIGDDAVLDGGGDVQIMNLALNGAGGS